MGGGGVDGSQDPSGFPRDGQAVSPTIRVLVVQAQEQPDQWVGGEEIGSLRLDARWQAPRLILSLKAMRLEDEAVIVANVAQAWQQLEVGESEGWKLRTQHGPLLFRFYAVREMQDLGCSESCYPDAQAHEQINTTA